MVQITCLVESVLLAAKHRCSIEAADVADFEQRAFTQVGLVPPTAYQAEVWDKEFEEFVLLTDMAQLGTKAKVRATLRPVAPSIGAAGHPGLGGASGAGSPDAGGGAGRALDGMLGGSADPYNIWGAGADALGPKLPAAAAAPAPTHLNNGARATVKLGKADLSLQTINGGKWSAEEEKAFVEGLQTYGRNWPKIQKCCVNTRTLAQIRGHAQKFFLKWPKLKTAWGFDEKAVAPHHLQLLDLQKLHEQRKQAMGHASAAPATAASAMLPPPPPPLPQLPQPAGAVQPTAAAAAALPPPAARAGGATAGQARPRTGTDGLQLRMGSTDPEFRAYAAHEMKKLRMVSGGATARMQRASAGAVAAMAGAGGAGQGNLAELIGEGHGGQGGHRGSTLGSLDLDILDSYFTEGSGSGDTSGGGSGDTSGGGGEQPPLLSNFEDLDSVLSDIIVRTPARMASGGAQARSPQQPQSHGELAAAVAAVVDERLQSNPGREKFFRSTGNEL